MCGICGFYAKRNITIEKLRVMNDSMIHRGPDDHGEEIYDARNGYYIGMAHRRLSIIDLSQLGHQPMQSADGRLSIVFNGEIYNFGELKKELKEYPFKTCCDTEVILASFLRWGIKCVDHFNGMFAMAIYDRDTEEMYLFRDRIGKKPLYYWVDNENIIFASELKAIMFCPGFERKIRRNILSRYLIKQYINEPNTIFESVYKLEHGSYLKILNGKIEIHKYWDISKVYHQMLERPICDYNEAKEELKYLLKMAVKRRMIADVPVGTFLSGGYDSSLITSLAQGISGSKPLRTFSIGFCEKKYNEAENAKEIAHYLGTNHTELYCDEGDMLGLIESVPYFYDEPFADPSEIPTMLVSMLARKYVTVVLSGDGGDELFCGYNYYDIVKMAQKVDFLGKIAHLIGKIGNLETYYPLLVRTISQNRNPKRKTQIIADNYADCAKDMVICDKNDVMQSIYYETEELYNESNWQVCRMLLDMDSYLPNDILAKVDRASMKYSLECRCPILDKDVMEYSFRIKHNFKYKNKQKKIILKDITYDYIPRTLLERPKMGFGVPLDKWMRGNLKEKLKAYADMDYLKRQGIFEAKKTNQIIGFYTSNGDAGPRTGKNYSSLCWSFFMFQQWYERWVNI